MAGWCSGIGAGPTHLILTRWLHSALCSLLWKWHIALKHRNLSAPRACNAFAPLKNIIDSIQPSYITCLKNSGYYLLKKDCKIFACKSKYDNKYLWEPPFNAPTAHQIYFYHNEWSALSVDWPKIKEPVRIIYICTVIINIFRQINIGMFHEFHTIYVNTSV